MMPRFSDFYNEMVRVFSYQELELLSKQYLSERLDCICFGGSLRDVCFYLIQHCERMGYEGQLVAGCFEMKPNSRVFQDIASEWGME